MFTLMGPGWLSASGAFLCVSTGYTALSNYAQLHSDLASTVVDDGFSGVIGGLFQPRVPGTAGDMFWWRWNHGN